VSFAFIIPVFNGEKYLASTLESALNQIEKADEIIVVDDGSTDESVQIAKKYDVKLIQQQNAGAAAARNTAVSHSNSEWIVFLDGDDIALEQRIKKIKEKVKENPSLNLIANDEYEGNDQDGWIIKYLYNYYNPSRDLYSQLLKGCFLSTSAMAIKKELFDKVGGMDVELRSAQDYDLWLRVAPHAQFDFIKEPLTKYLVHSNSVTGNQLKRLECMKMILRKHQDSFSKNSFLKRFLIIHLEVLLTSIKFKKFSIIPQVLLSLSIGGLKSLFGTRI
jgi:glycosyltransferase involved in cell wall biosynthesis